MWGRRVLNPKAVVKANVEEKLTLASVQQVASNAVNVTFNMDASKNVTKDNLTIKSADGAVELSIKSVEFSADGKSARVTVFGNFTNGTEYKVNYDSTDQTFTASVGAVAGITVDTASAEQNVATDIKFTLKDAQGIDVTPSIDIDSHVFVTVTGSYSALENNYASKARITMNNIGDIADVTVTYTANQTGAENVVGTGKITCVSPTAKLGTKIFANTDKINDKSECAKFYLGLKDENVSVAVNGNTDKVYFCATDANGDVISYDSYAVESANDNIAAATASVSFGKFARFNVSGNNVGTTQLNVTASKNGVDAYYTIPVIVTKTDAATKMVVSQDRTEMSTIDEPGYNCTVTVSLQDANNKKVDSDFTAELLTEVSGTAPTISNPTASGSEVNFTLNFADAEATTNAWKTYTFKITGVDKNHKDVTFNRNVTVRVKKLPDSLTNIGYQIELTVNGKVANTIEETDLVKRAITSKLYVTSNGLFAGYITANAITNGATGTAGKYAIPAKNRIQAVSGCAVRGVDVFVPSTGDLVSKVAISMNAGENITQSASGSAMTFSSVKAVRATAGYVDTSNEVAEVGSYNIRYAYTSDGKDVKYVSAPFTVTRDYTNPTAKASTTSVSNVNDFDKIIEEAITTNVDMNNNTSGYASITTGNGGFYKKATTGVDKYIQLTNADVKGDRIVVGYVQVSDNVNASETWLFYAPINVTFKQR